MTARRDLPPPDPAEIKAAAARLADSLNRAIRGAHNTVPCFDADATAAVVEELIRLIDARRGPRS